MEPSETGPPMRGTWELVNVILGIQVPHLRSLPRLFDPGDGETGWRGWAASLQSIRANRRTSHLYRACQNSNLGRSKHIPGNP